MKLPIKSSGDQQRRDKEIVDAEWTEIESPNPTQHPNAPNGFFKDLLGDVLRGMGGLLMFLGVLAVLAILSIATSEAPTEPVTDASYTAISLEEMAQQGNARVVPAPQEDDWSPLMLCEDEQVLDYVVATRREWLALLLDDMAIDGSYILPKAGDAIAEGAARATITFPEGTQALGADESNGDELMDAVLVRCSGTMEIRHAFKLPDNTWSGAFLTFPDARFDVRAGADGFTIEFPDVDRELSTGMMNIAGAQLRLQAMREITSGAR